MHVHAHFGKESLDFWARLSFHQPLTMGRLTCPCPTCQTQTVPWLEPEVRLLENTSKDALVNYYRCDVCWCVWTVPKSDPDAAPKILTVVKID